jgi:pimeloyl-ACP methyl ester carboxylesterase
MSPRLQPALSHERKTVRGSAGPLSYYVRGHGKPVLLIHSINAAASAYEMRPIYESDVPGARFYAPDLPGFGYSDRSNRDYSVDLYVRAIHDMLAVIEQDVGSQPVDAVALSLSSEFLARAAIKRPDRFEKLVFITPTGFDKRSDGLRAPSGTTRQVSGVLPALSLPLLSDALYAALTSRPSIRYFLQKTYGSKDIDEGLFEYAYATSHQAGAKHAPLAFLSGKLFSADIRTVYERLQHEVWMPHATRGDFADFSGASWVDGRSSWRRQPFPTGALVHFEQQQHFIREWLEFLVAEKPTTARPA